MSEFIAGDGRHSDRHRKLALVTRTTPLPQSTSTRPDAVHGQTHPLLGVSDRCGDLFEPATRVSQGRASFLQLLISTAGLLAANVGAASMANLDKPFLFEQAHRFARRVDRDAPCGRQLAVRRQLVPRAVFSLLNLRAEFVRDPLARPPPSAVMRRVVAHGPSVPPTVLTQIRASFTVSQQMKSSNTPGVTVNIHEDSIPLRFTPDGLDEATIDALIEEAYGEVNDSQSRPSWLPTDPAEHRRIRRRGRQVVRLLPTVLPPQKPSKGAA